MYKIKKFYISAVLVTWLVSGYCIFLATTELRILGASIVMLVNPIVFFLVAGISRIGESFWGTQFENLEYLLIWLSTPMICIVFYPKMLSCVKRRLRKNE